MGDQKDTKQAGGESIAVINNNAEVVDVDGDIDDDPKIDEDLKQKLIGLMSHMCILPPHIKRKVKALKNYQVEHVRMETEFYKELHVLEMKYEEKFKTIYEKRAAVVTGAYEPTDLECEFAFDDESDKEDEEVLSNQVGDMKLKEEEAKDVKGIPDFWLTCFKNSPAIAEMIEEYDEPILKHLIDVRAITSNDPMNFTLEFHFEPNEYFSNTVLTKLYDLKCEPDESEIFAFEGPEIVKGKGTVIDWKKGKNVTIKTIKKKQKHKSRGSTRTVTKTVANDSFFNYFSPPTPPDNEAELDEEMQAILSNDFEVGNLIKDRVIPHAVLFFTGENLIDEEYDEDEDEEDDDEYDEDEDEESENEGEDTKQVNRKKSKGPQGAAPGAPPPDCKQQ